MKRLAILLIVFSVSTVHAQLPKVTTTQKKAIEDLVKNVRNEEWFKPRPDALNCIFRNTAVGLRHAIDRYNEMRTLFNTDDCEVEDIISSIATKPNGELDYEMLSITISQESSEIVRHCRTDDPVVKTISLRSESKGFLSLVLVLRGK